MPKNVKFFSVRNCTNTSVSSTASRKTFFSFPRDKDRRWAGTLMGCWQLFSVVLGLDLYTSLHDMEDLAQHEIDLMHFMYDYITHQQTELTTLVEKYKQFLQIRPVEQPLEEYTSHPMNAFSLIKRLAREWPLVLHLMVEQAADQRYVIEMPPDLIQLPGEDDMRSAFRGLGRLQEVYQIRTEQFVEDNLDGVPSNYRMTAMDCYEMGKHWYERTEFALAQSWFDQALEKISEGDSTVQRELVSSHFYLAETFSAGCLPTYHTAATNNLLHDMFVNHPNLVLSSDLAFGFNQALAKNCSWVLHTREMTKNPFLNKQLTQDYSEMCIGPEDIPVKDLKCYYIHYNNPRLLVAPFKAEELYLDPPILIFHDIISDNEIEKMKASFYRVMTECETVQTDQRSSRSPYRTCHVGWVVDKFSETSARLSRRMADMSNLNLEFSELNQVASYGLGGEFQLHNDPLLNLNDVPSGGRTVFPNIKVSIVPRKGSAVLWFNLDSRSQVLPAMLHGGCPVLRGSKWVLNKWVREAGQDLQKTCPSKGHFPTKYFYLN